MDPRLEPIVGFGDFSGLEPAIARLAERLGPLTDDPMTAFASGRLEAALSLGSAEASALDPRQLATSLGRWLTDGPTSEPAPRPISVGALDVASAGNALEVPWLREAMRHTREHLDLARIRDDAWPLLARWSEWAAPLGPWRPKGRRRLLRVALRRRDPAALPWQLTTLVWCGAASGAFWALQRLASEPGVQESWQRPLLALVACGWQRPVFELIDRVEVERIDDVSGALAVCADQGLAPRVVRWLEGRPAREMGRALTAIACCANHLPGPTLELLRSKLDEAPHLLVDFAPSLLTLLEASVLTPEDRSWIIEKLCGQLALDHRLLADARLVGAVLVHESERTTELMEHAVRSLFPQRIGDSMARLLQHLPGFAPRVLRQLVNSCDSLADVVEARLTLRQLERLALPLELGPWIDRLLATSTLEPRAWNDLLWTLAFTLRGEDHRRELFRRLRFDADRRHDLVALHRRLRERILRGCHRAAAEPAIDRALEGLVAAFEALAPHDAELIELALERHGPLAPPFRDAVRGEAEEISLADPGQGWEGAVSTTCPGHLRFELPPEQAEQWFGLTEERHRPLPIAPALAVRRLGIDRSEVWTRYCGPSLDRVAATLGAGGAPPRAWLRRMAHEAPPELTPLHEGVRALVRCLAELQQGLGERGLDPGLPPADRLAVELVNEKHWASCRAAGQTVNTLPYDGRYFSFDPADLLDPRWRVIVRLRGPGDLRHRIEPLPWDGANE